MNENMTSLTFPIPAAILDVLASVGVTPEEFVAYLSRRDTSAGAIIPMLERLRIAYREQKHADGYHLIPVTPDEFAICDADRAWTE